MKKRDGLPQGMRFNVFRRDGFKCRYCGRSSPDVVLHCDHVVARSKGGLNTEDNLVTACSDCNYGKGVKDAGNVPVVPRAGTLEGLFGLELAVSEVSPALTVPEYQFRVLRHLGDERYLVQLYDYWFGQPSNVEERQDLLNPEKFRLFQTPEQWRVESTVMMNREAEVFRSRLAAYCKTV